MNKILQSRAEKNHKMKTKKKKKKEEEGEEEEEISERRTTASTRGPAKTTSKLIIN